MPFTIRPNHRFPVPCSMTYNAGPFQGQGTMWNPRVQVGVSQETSQCDKGKPSRYPFRCRMNDAF